jgi:hypothetical protein
MDSLFSGAYEVNGAIDSRILGFQDYAIPKITGRTGWMQGDRASLDNNNFHISGVFNAGNTRFGDNNVDDNTGWRPGAVNTFDTRYVFPDNTSEDEVRVKNRLMKVWKRIS